MRRKLLVLVLLLCLTISLAGCGGEKESNTKDETGTQNTGSTEKTDGKRRVVTIWYDGTEEASVKILEKDFEKLHTDIDLQFEIVPYSDLSTKEMTACQASKGPDIMWQSYAWTNSFAKMGLLMSYSDYLAESDAVDLENDFDPVALELGTVNDKVYGLPWSMEAMCLVYNKQMFKDAGLDPESPPKNWEEVIDYAQKLTVDKDGDGTVDQYGYGLVGNNQGNTWFRFIPELWSTGGQVANKEMTESTLNSPEAIEAITYYTDLLIKYHAAPESSVSNGSAEVRTLFNNQNVAMYIDGQSAVKNIQNDAPDIDVGVALWPGKEGPLNAGLGGYYIATPKNAANPDDAWTFIEHFLSKEVQEYFPNAFPANLKARDTDRFNDEISQVFASQLKNTANFQPLSDTPAAQEIILTAIQSILAGVSTPEEALNTAKESLDATLQ